MAEFDVESLLKRFEETSKKMAEAMKKDLDKLIEDMSKTTEELLKSFRRGRSAPSGSPPESLEEQLK